MPRQRIDITDIEESAIAIADTHGVDGLTLALVAEDLGVQSSALYNHVDGVDGLRHVLAHRATRNLAGALRDAAVGLAGADAIWAIAQAYRTFAHEHPGQHAAALLPPDLSSGQVAEAGADIVEVIAKILVGFGIDGDHRIHAARAVRSAVHGFVALEAIDGFTRPADIDDSFHVMVEMLTDGLARH